MISASASIYLGAEHACVSSRLQAPLYLSCRTASASTVSQHFAVSSNRVHSHPDVKMALLVTALYASILGLIFIGLSLFIGLSRAGSGVHHGASKNGKEDTLFASRIRVSLPSGLSLRSAWTAYLVCCSTDIALSLAGPAKLC